MALGFNSGHLYSGVGLDIAATYLRFECLLAMIGDCDGLAFSAKVLFCSSSKEVWCFPLLNLIFSFSNLVAGRPWASTVTFSWMENGARVTFYSYGRG